MVQRSAGFLYLTSVKLGIITESATQIKSTASFLHRISPSCPSCCVPYCIMPKLATGDFSPVLYLGLNTAVLAMIVASLLASFAAP